MYYEPEHSTINYIYYPLIDKYIRDGYKVNVIAPNPTRGLPRKKVKEYRKNYVKEIKDNLTLYRVNCFTYKRYNKFNLLFRYLSVSRKCANQLKKIESDEVFVQTSPPIFYAYKASKIAKKRGMKIYYNVQDIYPDNIFNSKSLTYKIINHYQKKTLQNADEISTLSIDMVNTLLKKGIDKSKIIIKPNGPTVSLKEYDQTTLERVKQDYGFKEDKINILYAGNMGYLQDIDVILSTAKKVIAKTDKYNFIIVGEGAQRDRIESEIKELNSENVHFFFMAPIALSPYLYKLADYNVITLLPEVIYTACPLKTAMIKEANKKIIACVDEESNYAKELKEFREDTIIIPKRNAKLLAKILLEKEGIYEQN
jgi:glycosyltransferase involved in cell wall biosynthesis